MPEEIWVFEMTDKLMNIYEEVHNKLIGEAPPFTGIVLGILGTLFAVASLFTIFLDIGAFVITGFIWLGKKIASWFNETDDDEARKRLGNMNCDQVNALSEKELHSMTESLLDGPTGDDDEAALLKIVECLNCDRLTGTYWPHFGSRIQADTDGSEFDRLRVAMRRCRLVNFSDWDDDATRVYIHTSSCSDLQLLTITEIKQLLRNMFSGATGDDDERMINKLISCLGSGTVQTLVHEPGFFVSDFDDEVDGSEWTQLKNILRNKGVSV